jgi:hypothetical protein
MHIIAGLIVVLLLLYAVWIWCLVRISTRMAPPPDPVDKPYRFQRQKEAEHDSN